MKTITATELKENLMKYMNLCQDEDVLVTKNGTPIMRLTSPNPRKKSLDEFISYAGILGDPNLDYEALLAERDNHR